LNSQQVSPGNLGADAKRVSDAADNGKDGYDESDAYADAQGSHQASDSPRPYRSSYQREKHQPVITWQDSGVGSV
jgi:hypothetical protein